MFLVFVSVFAAAIFSTENAFADCKEGTSCTMLEEDNTLYKHQKPSVYLEMFLFSRNGCAYVDAIIKYSQSFEDTFI
ncbi:MAG: hypothetical protein H0U75_02750 [Legionella sp.]|nr:hypothetical protein [Legionella sp.]